MDASTRSETATSSRTDPDIWSFRTEFFPFKFGPFFLARIPLRVAVLTTPFSQLPEHLPDRLDIDIKECDAALCPEHPVDPTAPLIVNLNDTIRYISFSDIRYFVDLSGSFKDYLKKLSAKRRYNLLRTIRKFAEMNKGVVDCRVFSTPQEIVEFQKIAVAISEKTYKRDIGWTFQSNHQFRQELMVSAERGNVRGYVLYSKDIPVAYAFCRIEGSTIVYTHIGYEPYFTEHSPGTVLLHEILQRLFSEKQFEVLDFMGGRYWQYKRVYSTREIPTATVWWFPNSFRNRLLLRSHAALRKFESFCVSIKKACSRSART